MRDVDEAGRADHREQLGPAAGRYAVDAGRYAYARRSESRPPTNGTTWRNQKSCTARAGALVGSATSSSATRPRGRRTRAHSASTGREVDEVAQREPAREAVERAVGERQAQRRRRARAARRCARPRSMPGREVDADRRVARVGEGAAEVAGAAREVEHARAGEPAAASAPRRAASATSMRNVSSRLSRS